MVNESVHMLGAEVSWGTKDASKRYAPSFALLRNGQSESRGLIRLYLEKKAIWIEAGAQPAQVGRDRHGVGGGSWEEAAIRAMP